MKTAVIYYSMLGNTDYAANKIAEKLRNAASADTGEAGPASDVDHKDTVDLIRIEPEKAYPDKGAKKFLWGGKSAVMGEMPTLNPYTFDAEQYDRIILGSPVWASNFTPPMRTFLNENKGIANKITGVFVCFSGGGADKAIAKLKTFIGKEELAATLILSDPKDRPNPQNDEKIDRFCEMLLNPQA